MKININDKIQLVQDIGNEICEGCGPDRDCGEDPEDCFRIADAINYLDEYIDKIKNVLKKGGS